MSSLVTYTAHDGIAVLTLSNPPANTYSYELMLELDQSILRARMAHDVHVIVLTGAGDKFFCAGADIAMLAKSERTFKYNFCLHANETLCRLEQTPKLVIAALNGHAVGGGLEIAMAADIRIARQGAAQFGLPEVKLGVLPGTGGTQRLARLIGKARAMDLMVTGRLVAVEEAATLGILTMVWDEATLKGRSFVDAVVAYAGEFVPPRAASGAIGRIKRAVQSGAEVSLTDGIVLERELQQLLFQSEDAKEGLDARLAKREPRFQGR